MEIQIEKMNSRDEVKKCWPKWYSSDCWLDLNIFFYYLISHLYSLFMQGGTSGNIFNCKLWNLNAMLESISFLCFNLTRQGVPNITYFKAGLLKKTQNKKNELCTKMTFFITQHKQRNAPACEETQPICNVSCLSWMYVGNSKKM